MVKNLVLQDKVKRKHKGLQLRPSLVMMILVEKAKVYRRKLPAMIVIVRRRPFIKMVPSYDG